MLTYVVGIRFKENVRHQIEGTNEIVQLTQFDRFCYKINSTVTQPPKQGGQWLIQWEIKEKEGESMPKYSTVYFTSEENSNGKFFNEWWEGNVFEQIVKMDTRVTVGLRPVEHFYLDHDNKCSHQTNFNKYKTRIPADYNFTAKQCEASCSPVLFLMDTFPNCGWDYENYDDRYCVEIFVLLDEWREFKKETGYQRPCHILEYDGGKLFEDTNAGGYFSIIYQFSPPMMKTVYEEYLIFDIVGMIGSVGGTLGMCIGFSFSGIAWTVLEFVQSRLLRFV